MTKKILTIALIFYIMSTSYITTVEQPMPEPPVIKAIEALVVSTPVVVQARAPKVSRSGIERYTATELQMLAKIIWAEAKNQPRAGKIAVVNVVMNRIAYRKLNGRSFSSTISGVIFQPGQFSPIKDGSYNRAPVLEENIMIAEEALSGKYTVSKDTIFFGTKVGIGNLSPSRITARIGDHIFYK